MTELWPVCSVTDVHPTELSQACRYNPLNVLLLPTESSVRTDQRFTKIVCEKVVLLSRVQSTVKRSSASYGAQHHIRQSMLSH